MRMGRIKYLGAWVFPSGSLEEEIVGAHEGAGAELGAEVDEGVLEGGAFLVAVGVEEAGEGGVGAGVDVGEFGAEHADADPPVPGFGEQALGHGVEILRQAGGFEEAFTAFDLVHVGVADFDTEGAGAFFVPAHPEDEVVDELAQGGDEEGFVDGVFLERALVAVGLGGFAGGDDRAFVDAPAEIAQGFGSAAGEQAEEVDRDIGDLLDAGEAGGFQHPAEFRADSGQPPDVEGGEERAFFPVGDGDEPVWLAQFRGDLGNQLVAGDSLGDPDLEALGDGFPDGVRGGAGFHPAVPRHVEIPLVDAGDFDFRGKIVGVAEHQAAEEFVLLEVAGDEDEVRAGAHRPGGGHRWIP